MLKSTALAFAVFCVVPPATTGAVEDALNTSQAWHFLGGGWSLEDDVLMQRETAVITAAYFTGSAYSDVSVSMRFTVLAEGGGVRAVGLIARSVDSSHGYRAHFDTRNDQVILFKGDLMLAGNELLRKTGVPLDTGRAYEAKLECSGRTIRVFLDGELVLETADDSWREGQVGLYTSQAAARFENIRVDGTEAALKAPWKEASPASGVPQEQAGGRILAIKTLCKQPGRFIGWPSIAQSPNGDLLAVFSGDRSAHISPEGKVQMVRSTDGGETWSEAITIFDTPIDDRDSGIIQTAKDTMLVSWFTNPGGGEWQGHWTIRSEDNGHTWCEPVRTEVTTPHGPIQLTDGRILYVGQRPHESHSDTYDVGIQESVDDGRSWQTIGTFPVPEGAKMLCYDECHVVERADGTLVILFRDCFEPHRIRQSGSTDGGRTWTAPHVTDMHGYPPHVIRLRDNRLLTVYAKRWEPFGQYACLSSDGGITWAVEKEVRLSVAWASDIGYPASVQLNDGTVWTVYYQPERPGEKPCLMGTHWAPVPK